MVTGRESGPEWIVDMSRDIAGGAVFQIARPVREQNSTSDPTWTDRVVGIYCEKRQGCFKCHVFGSSLFLLLHAGIPCRWLMALSGCHRSSRCSLVIGKSDVLVMITFLLYIPSIILPHNKLLGYCRVAQIDYRRPFWRMALTHRLLFAFFRNKTSCCLSLEIQSRPSHKTTNLYILSFATMTN
ncbi:hypothetical protein CABS01_08899 [Colletotrichum abscissum]|uniref:uncharacterized protein n=1 Tax=Colletotrichum abscissum TaxID=1671311 RepID=UPI0027D562AD|nr:uncharacterized protein CABS01_08899 [Colletotrichum abscissum]KAK1505121.1 hypothetical protein CABS01_08899 [Colletotrichum abscissum]